MEPRPVVGLPDSPEALCPSPQVQRLPFLPSSNLSLDILRGNDETIGFEDILNGEWHSAPGNPVLDEVTAASRVCPREILGDIRSHSQP